MHTISSSTRPLQPHTRHISGHAHSFLLATVPSLTHDTHMPLHLPRTPPPHCGSPTLTRTSHPPFHSSLTLVVPYHGSPSLRHARLLTRHSIPRTLALPHHGLLPHLSRWTPHNYKIYFPASTYGKQLRLCHVLPLQRRGRSAQRRGSLRS